MNSIQDGGGNELTWVKRGGFDGLVLFPKPIASGTKMTLRMRFTGLDSIRKVNPSFCAMDRGGWLPFVRFADFIDTLDLTVRTPDRVHGARDRQEGLGYGGQTASARRAGPPTSPVSFPTVIFGDYLSADVRAYRQEIGRDRRSR